MCVYEYLLLFLSSVPLSRGQNFCDATQTNRREVINCLGALLLSLKTFSARWLAGRMVYPIPPPRPQYLLQAGSSFHPLLYFFHPESSYIFSFPVLSSFFSFFQFIQTSFIFSRHSHSTYLPGLTRSYLGIRQPWQLCKTNGMRNGIASMCVRFFSHVSCI